MAERTLDPVDVRTRQRQRQEKLVEYVGELLIPVTDGFDHVNLDMTFSFLGNFELARVENLSTAINICHIYGLKQSEYLLRGDLATLLNSRKSRNAKSMDIFTTVATQTKQTFEDVTPVQPGFRWLGFGKKQQKT